MAIFATNFAYGQQKKSATTTIDAAELIKNPKAIKGNNLILKDSALDKYAGTWIWKNGNKSLTIQLSTKLYQLGDSNHIVDVTFLSGYYQYIVDGKVIYFISGKDISGSSGGKKDTVNVFMDIKSRNTQVALLAIYLPDHTLKLEVEKNRFEFKNDKNFELPTPLILTKQ